MYLFPHNEARAAPEAEENVLLKRAIGDDNGDDDTDPFQSLLSEIFGGGDQDPTSTTARRTTSTTARITTPTPVIPLVPTSTTTSSRLTPTSTLTSSTHSTAQATVVTSPPPNLTTTVPLSTATIFSTASNSSANNAATAPTTKSGLPSVVIGVIVAASVIFGLIFLSLITRKILQTRRRARRNTWARGSVIAPFAPTVFKEKELPPPPAETAQPEYPQYPAYPPAAVTYANQLPYSPAAPSSAGYPAPYPFGGSGNTPMLQTNQNQLFNTSSYTPADLAGPVVIQQTPPTPLTATAPSGQTSVVKRTFVPSLPDELSIATGDQVRVISAYDDGWALCEKVSTGEKGVVPQECLEEVKGSTTSNTPGQQIAANDSATRLNRASSLRREQDKTY